MARVFISHSSRDVEAARALHEWLKAQNFEHAFLDVDETQGLQPGSRWEQQLYGALQRCQAVILLLTPQWLASKWCFAEFAIARSIGKQLFPVIVEPLQGASVAPELQALDLLVDREARLAQLARELTRVALEGGGGFAWEDGRVPYPGLAAFEASDAAVYFGRAPEVQAVAERLRARRATAGPRVLAVLGASGTGKSSLVRAGVLPLLARDRAAWCVLPPMRPRADPVRELARAFAEGLAEGEARAERAQELHARLLAAGDAFGPVLDDLVEQAVTRQPQHSSETGLLLTLDQAEELFTTSAPPQRLPFARLLQALAARHGQRPVLVLLTMRSDLFGQWQTFEPALPKVEVYSLPPLRPERLRDIIEGPARVAGFGTEPALAAAVAADAHGPDALPLVAFALRELYLATVGTGATSTIRVADYQRLGDPAHGLSPLEAVVRDRADSVLRDLALDTKGLQALRAAFVERLTNIDDQGRFTRRPAAWRDLPAAAQPALRAFVHARLLTTRTDDAAVAASADDGLVEVTHEALLRRWPLAAGWLSEEIDWLAGRRQLEQALAQWKRSPPEQRDEALLQGVLLQRAADWLARRPAALEDAQRSFVQASLARQARHQRKARNLRWGLFGAIAGTLLFALALGESWRSSERLGRDLAVQRLLRLATAALEGQRADRALELAAQAHRLTPDARTHSALLQTGLALSPWQASALAPAPAASGAMAAAATVAVATGPQGWLIGDSNGQVLAGDATAPLLAAGAQDRNRPQPVKALAATQDSGFNAIRGDGSWWRVRSAKPTAARWRGPPLEWAALAPDGSVALVLTEGDRRLLRVACPDGVAACTEQSLSLPEAAGTTAAWDSASQRAAVALADGRLAVFARDGSVPLIVGVAWPMEEREARRVHALASLPTENATASATGSWLAAGGQALVRRMGDTPADNTAPNAWFVADDQALPGRPEPVAGGRAWEAWPSQMPSPLTRLTVAPGGRHVAAACRLQEICVWRIDGGGRLRGLETLAGHPAPVAALSWSSDGRRLLSVDIQGGHLTWAAAPSPAHALGDAAGEPGAHPLNDIDIDPRGQRLAAVRADGAWFVWSLVTGDPGLPARLEQRSAPPPKDPPLPDGQRLRWHPARPWLALAGLNGGAGLLRLDAQPPRFDLLADTSLRVESLLFAADGSALFGGTQGGEVWRSALDPASGVARGLPQPLPPRHAEAVLALAAAAGGGPPVSADASGVVWVHDGRTAPLLEMTRAAGQPVGLDSLSLSPDGGLVVVAGNHGDAFLVAMGDGRVLQRLETGAGMITHAAFSRDGRTIAAVDDQQRLHLWHAETTSGTAFAPLASVRIASVPGAGVERPPARLQGLRRLAWLPDGRLAIATRSGHVLLMDVSAQAWLARADGLRR